MDCFYDVNASVIFFNAISANILAMLYLHWRTGFPNWINVHVLLIEKHLAQIYWRFLIDMYFFETWILTIELLAAPILKYQVQLYKKWRSSGLDVTPEVGPATIQLEAWKDSDLYSCITIKNFSTSYNVLDTMLGNFVSNNTPW